jgi:peptidoglycan/LPS O-acetylase OafA/YrhL
MGRATTALGHWSYAFYSLQPAVLLPFILYRDQLASWSAWLANGWIIFLLTFPTLLALSAIAFKLVEDPLRVAIRVRLAPRAMA